MMDKAAQLRVVSYSLHGLYLLTPTLLRSSTLSFAGKKEGENCLFSPLYRLR